MAGREVNCEYCRVVVFEVDRFCVGCGAPRKAFPDEVPITYKREPLPYPPTSEPSWHTICSTAVYMGSSADTMGFSVGSTYRTISVADTGY